MTESVALGTASTSARLRRKRSPAAMASSPARPTATRLSQSPIWQLQRRYFAEAGIEAWRHNTVPSYVTTNPYIAGTYVRLVSAFLEDCRRSGALPSDGGPVHVVELGAGSGRFAHHFLTQFDDGAGQVRYVLTDVSRANIDFWRGHPSFQKFVAQGRLDFARFDAEADDSIRLEHSGATIAPGYARPLIVIANYVFDGIAQDAFVVENGRLHECQAIVDEGTPIDSSPSARIAAIGVNYQPQPARPDYYDDAAWNALLVTHSWQVYQSSALICAPGRRSTARASLRVAFPSASRSPTSTPCATWTF